MRAEVEHGHCDYMAWWGKCSKDSSFHRLAWHSLDVTAVFEELWASVPRWRTLASRQLHLREDDAGHLLQVLVALHDIGKFAAGFQDLASSEVHELLGRQRIGAPYTIRHDALGTWWMGHWLRSRYASQLPVGKRERRILCRKLEDVCGPVFWHHGQPGTRCYGDNADAAAAWNRDRNGANGLHAADAFADDVVRLFDPEDRWLSLVDEIPHQGAAKEASWILAGIVTVADWLGSNERWFPYSSMLGSLDEYYVSIARPAARQAVQSSGVVPPEAPGDAGFRALFPQYRPNSSQSLCNRIPIRPEPMLYLLEDQTGSGKTEAALTLAHRLCAEGRAETVYFALPTMATADAMFARCLEKAGPFFGGDRANVVLAHGRSSGHPVFAQLAERTLEAEGYVRTAGEATELTGGATCSAWFADSRKRALLAALGIGTIDQALLSVLPSRHQCVRLCGLARSVLIVDEVHACDSYMLSLLKRLLEFHRKLGGTAILMSATFPTVLKADLAQAWREGVSFRASSSVCPSGLALEAANVVQNSHYPLLTEIPTQSMPACYPIAADQSRAVEIPLQTMSDSGAVRNELIRRARQGEAVAWIRNTVADARDAAALLHEAAPDLRTFLFHARFMLADRRRKETDLVARFGRKSAGADRCRTVVVATQVIEQSLDLDFDVLCTDLCPVDLLIQRAGRYRRHRRNAAGECHSEVDARGKHGFLIHGPAWEEDPGADWYSQHAPRAAYVYSDHGVIWRTLREVRRRGGLSLPRDARGLVDAVYAATALTPPQLRDSEDRVRAEELSSRSIAESQLLQFDAGYEQHKLDGRWHSEARSVTRLGEVSMQLRLVDAHNNEPLPPATTWSEAEVAVALWRFGRDADIAMDYAASMRDRFGSLMKDGGRFVIPVPMEREGEGWSAVETPGQSTIYYDQRFGLLVNESMEQ